MLQNLRAMLAPALMERLTLAINHVLSSEAAATARLKPHAGRSLRVHLDLWPSLLPEPPTLGFVITPAGMLEWQGLDAPPGADLHVHVDAANPAALLAQTLAGETPRLSIDGDAALATDIHWLAENLRWDIAADLEPVVGPAAAHQIVRVGSAIKRGLAQVLARVGPVAGGGSSSSASR